MRKCAENSKLCDPAPIAPNRCLCFQMISAIAFLDLGDVLDTWTQLKLKATIPPGDGFLC